MDIYAHSQGGLFHELSNTTFLNLGKPPLDPREFDAVWWRQKPNPVVPAYSTLSLYDYYFSHREWGTVLDYLDHLLEGAFCINDRRRAKEAENKLYQLEIAGNVGMRVPKTVFTQFPHIAVRSLRARGVSRCVYKSFSPYMPPNGTLTYTTELDVDGILNESVGDLSTSTPGIFQELIVASHELRVTVVGQRTFSARIEVPDDACDVDWRASTFSNSYFLETLPLPLEQQILKLHAHLGLEYAAYDMIVDKHGEAYFLEANPAGQWMWLEDELGLEISEAISELLQAAGR